VGWCSWYEFYERVTEADVLRQLQTLDETPALRRLVDYVQIDDGYQRGIGDWLSCNAKFPRGLAPLAADVRARGMHAGVWTAPFCVGAASALFRAHPDWVVRSPDGAPLRAHFNPTWGRDRVVYALDATHPGALAWLERTFSALRAMGFTVFKIDFLAAGVRRGTRARGTRRLFTGTPFGYPPTLRREFSRVEAYRMGLEAVRRGAGEDAFIIGCGAPIGASVGLVDAMRVSADTAERWRPRLAERLFARDWGIPSVQMALRGNVARWWAHRALWINDPDCLVIRRRGSALTDAEVATQLTVLGLTGGLLALSDDLASVDAGRLAQALRVLPPTGATGAPARVMEKAHVEAFVCRAATSLDGFHGGGRDRAVVAAINWSDRAATLDVAAAAGEAVRHSLDGTLTSTKDCTISVCFAFEFWSSRLWLLAARDGRRVPAETAPHGCLALQVETLRSAGAACGGSRAGRRDGTHDAPGASNAAKDRPETRVRLVGCTLHMTAGLDGRVRVRPASSEEGAEAAPKRTVVVEGSAARVAQTRGTLWLWLPGAGQAAAAAVEVARVGGCDARLARVGAMGPGCGLLAEGSCTAAASRLGGCVAIVEVDVTSRDEWSVAVCYR
jgi:hypothetical protein